MATKIETFLKTAGFTDRKGIITVDLQDTKAMLEAGRNMELDSLCDKIYRFILTHIVDYFSPSTANDRLIELAQVKLSDFCQINKPRLASISHDRTCKLMSFNFEIK